MATATTKPHDRVRELEKELAAINAEAGELGRALAACEEDKYRVSDRELPDLMRRKELAQVSLDRAKARIAERQAVLDGLWATIRKNEAETQRQNRMLQVANLRADTAAAVNRLTAKLRLDSDPDLLVVKRGLAELQNIQRTMDPQRFPYPPECLAAQAAHRELVDQLFPIVQSVQSLLRLP
jgi:hypothetical protein